MLHFKIFVPCTHAPHPQSVLLVRDKAGFYSVLGVLYMLLDKGTMSLVTIKKNLENRLRQASGQAAAKLRDFSRGNSKKP